MNKSDYDKYYKKGGTYVIPVELFNELLDELEELKKNQRLKDKLQQKENIIKEVREYITYWHYRNDFRINSFTTGVKEELLEILDKENK